MGEADAAQGAQQHIGHRGKPQPQLVGAHCFGRGTIGIKVELALLDPVFHLAARAVELLVGWRASCSPRDSEVTTNRGLAWPSVHSALATTRRSRLQLSRVVQAKSLKRRADLPVGWLCSAASASSALIASTSRVLRARPNRKSTALFSHQAISASRAKPESARSRRRTAGQRWRMRATTRATSATLPALASTSAGRSFDTNKFRPQNT